MAGTWLPTYAIEVKHAGFISGGLLTTVLFAGVTIVLLLNGYLSDKIGRVKSTSLMAALAAIIMLIFTQASNVFMTFILVAMAGIIGA